MTRHAGHLLVECLTALGAQKAFGVPGESYLAVLDAMHDTAGRFDFINCRHEGGAAFMAAAWGKLTGQPGICMVTRGPGVTNASIGIHTAMQDSVPMIVLVGQVGTQMRGREAFQEIDYRAVFSTVAKWAIEVDHAARLPEILARAWKTAMTGRPGPVVVALPEDMLSAPTDVAALRGLAAYPEPVPSAQAMGHVHAILSQAERPLILVGGCGWNATGRHALQDFAERSDIPVAAVFRYQDQFDNFSPCFCGEAGVGMLPNVRDLIQDADTILAVGNRFGENSTAGWTLLDVPVPRQRLIHVHASAAELGKIYQPEIGIVSGVNAFAAALQSVSGPWAEWRARARTSWEAGFDLPAQPSPVDMGQVMVHLQKVLPADVIVTNGAGNFATWPNKFFRFGARARLLGPQSGAMGYGVPAAIAAKIAAPDRTVLCFAGDGDFQMSVAELATARQAGACPVILILNNGIYGTIRAHQEKHYPTRVSGTAMTGNPDFVALAQAYGFQSEHVARTADFADAFQRALASENGAVLDLDISPEALTPRASLSAIRQAALNENR
ncbi:MAG: thiamine pyrophosphate-dependent enzyme [Pseudomonadota bacterium]